MLKFYERLAVRSGIGVAVDMDGTVFGLAFSDGLYTIASDAHFMKAGIEFIFEGGDDVSPGLAAKIVALEFVGPLHPEEGMIQSNVDVFTESLNDVPALGKTGTALEAECILAGCLEERLEYGGDPPVFFDGGSLLEFFFIFYGLQNDAAFCEVKVYPFAHSYSKGVMMVFIQTGIRRTSLRKASLSGCLSMAFLRADISSGPMFSAPVAFTACTIRAARRVL